MREHGGLSGLEGVARDDKGGVSNSTSAIAAFTAGDVLLLLLGCHVALTSFSLACGGSFAVDLFLPLVQTLEHNTTDTTCYVQ